MPFSRATTQIALISLSIAAASPLMAQTPEGDLVDLDCREVVKLMDTVHTMAQSEDGLVQLAGREMVRGELQKRVVGETRPGVLSFVELSLEMIDEAWEWDGSKEDLLLKSRGRCETFIDTL